MLFLELFSRISKFELKQKENALHFMYLERMANLLGNLPLLGCLAQSTVAMLRTKISAYNAAPVVIQVSIENELVTEEYSYNRIGPNELQVWGRQAGTCKVSVLIGGQAFNISLTKGAENVCLTIRGYNNYDLK